jgi:hypothetical protein
MSKEHIWPKWLAERANVKRDGVPWHHGVSVKRVSPSAATIPLCEECNNLFGAKLEEPVSNIFERLEGGAGISDRDAELLVRWMWKFEGLFWNLQHFSNPSAMYSEVYTVRDRVLGPSLGAIRSHLTLGVSLIAGPDEVSPDWPLGIDSGISENNAIFVSGVFCRTALMVCLTKFAHLIAPQFGQYMLNPELTEGTEPCFFPPTNFRDPTVAVGVTKSNSGLLAVAHEIDAAQMAASDQGLVIPRRRIEIAPSLIVPRRRDRLV